MGTMNRKAADAMGEGGRGRKSFVDWLMMIERDEEECPYAPSSTEELYRAMLRWTRAQQRNQYIV